MELFYVFYIFVSAFILVQCTKNDDVHKSTKISNGRCSGDHMKIFRSHLRNATPKPYKMLMNLKPKPGHEFEPAAVYVEQCSGHCRDGWTPMPTKMKMKKFTVQSRLKGNPMSTKCVFVDVPAHKMCKCQCVMMREDCKNRKIVDQSTCECVCEDRNRKKQKCEKSKRGMEWRDADCSCQCTEKIMDCASGEMWNKEKCECIQD